MRLNRFFTLHLIWLSVLFAPVVADAQVKPKKAPQADTLKTISLDPNIFVPADTVLPGQKNPFTESQRLEGDNKRFLKRAVIPSAILIGAGIYTIQERGIISSFDVNDARDKVLSDFATNADDFLMLGPLVGLYGFNIISSQNRHELGRQTLLLLASGTLASAFVWPTKKLTDIDRPNGKPFAFPSGHTAYAFTIATFMDKEFRHKSPWVSVASYSIAGATGVLRVLNDAHWMADVLAGAGVGILSVNTVYWVHAKLTQGGGLNTAVIPVVLPNGSPGMGLTVTF
ncbi:phosphatase PAP2 family protein [Pontibacter cellulosilyticus]|uniref:Phosphatase PAP2 family protein n=1 Tax=Pontibacter cellulosilyticus TaxID=1720253 RepID=A0A923SJP0_9BACT|nr:phosphatase PAP2 family protein [Pontibacter cellulosilyticus]MBC5993877.1 phosphatase PAP2 family protein [Pontibacter cellulosilyticus]